MESSTTDTCEWCNRPMLPAGATVSGKAAKEMQQSGRPLAGPPAPAVEREVGIPLQQAQAENVDSQENTEAAPQQEVFDVVLRPLGHGEKQVAHQAEAVQSALPAVAPSAAPQRSGPSHGLPDEATHTSIDISQYVGSDQSIFKPIEKDAGFTSASSLDRVTTKRAARDDTGPKWSENQRLMRCAITGGIIGMVFGLAEFFIKHKVEPTDLFNVVSLGSSDSLLTAFKLGILMGILYGFMLGALLVKWQKGSGIGMIVGMVLGFSAGHGIYSVLPGALSGIFVGRFATLGIRRVINV